MSNFLSQLPSLDNHILINTIMANIVAAFYFILCFLAFSTQSGGQEINTGIKCECGGFNGEKIMPGDKPLIAQNPFNTTCDENGVQFCQMMCLNLAMMSEGKEPKILCAYFKHASNLKLSMFTRVCDKKWVFSGVTMQKPVCCHEGKEVECA